jgi:hypothetical protein
MAVLELAALPIVGSGVAMLLLAAVLLAMDFRKRVNRAFAALLVLRGVSLILSPLDLGARGSLAIQGLIPYIVLPLAPLTVYFASIYPRRRGWLGRPGGGWWTLALAVALDALYMVWHDGYWTLAPAESMVPLLRADEGVQFVGFGPLALVGMASFPLLSGLAFLFALDYTRSPPGTIRASHFLVAAGFLVNGLFDGTTRLLSLARLDAASAAAYPWWPWGWAIPILPALAIIPALAALALIVRHQFRRGKGQERAMEVRLYVFAALALASALLPRPASGDFFSAPSQVILGLWRLALPVVVTYALLRYALFDIDVKVRAAVAWTVVAGVFAGAWFIGSNLLQNVLAEWTGTGTVGGLVAAALLAWATPPMIRFGRWSAAKLMPGVHDFSKETRQAAEVYRQQFEMLQEDGVLTPKERQSLDRLRDKLGLPKPMARDVAAGARSDGSVRNPPAATALKPPMSPIPQRPRNRCNRWNRWFFLPQMRRWEESVVGLRHRPRFPCAVYGK